MPFWSSKKVKDPVCGMEIDPRKAAATYNHHGTTFYFCSPSCRESFEKEPARYHKTTAMGRMNGEER